MQGPGAGVNKLSGRDRGTGSCGSIRLVTVSFSCLLDSIVGACLRRQYLIQIDLFGYYAQADPTSTFLEICRGQHSTSSSDKSLRYVPPASRSHDNTTPSALTNDKDNEETMLPTMLQPLPIKLPRVCSSRQDSFNLAHFYCLLPFSCITGSSTPYRVVPCKMLIAGHPLSLPSPSILVLQTLAALRTITNPR